MSFCHTHNFIADALKSDCSIFIIYKYVLCIFIYLQKSNFSINRILQTVTPTTASSSDDVISSPSTISIQQQQKTLLETATKMIWLQQLASAQHHPSLSSKYGACNRPFEQ